MTNGTLDSDPSSFDARSSARSILHVLAPAPFGGLERVVLTLAVGQRERGCRVAVAALLSSSTEPVLLDALRAGDVSVSSVVTGSRSYAAQIRRIADVAAAVGADVVHSHGYLPDVLTGIMPRQRSFARTTTVHGFTGGDWKNRLYEWLQLRALRRFDSVVAVSAPIRDRLVRAGVAADRVHVIRNALPPLAGAASPAEARSALGVPQDTFSIGWVGRLSREKGLDVLIDTLPLLDMPFHLTVVGDGQERQRLESLASDHGVSDRVRFTGIVPDSGRFMRAFDVLVLSSRTEGTPITLLEAMQASVAVVATSVGGIPHVISAAEGLLVPPERPDLLAQAVRQTYLDPVAAAERARRAAARIDADFSRDPWIDAYERVYDLAQQSGTRLAS